VPVPLIKGTGTGSKLTLQITQHSVRVRQGNRAHTGSALIYGSEKKQPKTAIYCRKVSRVA